MCEETDLLDKIIPRMYEVMYRVAKVSCDYVKHGRLSFWNLASADDSSENGGWAGLPGGDRRNGQRVDDGRRRLRPCSECGRSPPNQGDW